MNLKDGKHQSYAKPASPAATIRYACILSVLLTVGNVSFAQAKEVTKLAPADYFEIYNLYSAYSVALDTGNGAARVATFTPDGTFQSFLSKQVPEHMDILLKRTNAYPHKKIPDARMMHILINIHVTPTSEGANGTCYALFPRKIPSGHYIFSPGFYTDTLVKTSAGWRFKTRQVTIEGSDYDVAAGR